MYQNPKPYKFGIALSGGGARGIVHIGVLEALHKYGIRPEIISGASAGALVGVFYAAGMEPLQILELVKANKMVKMFKWQVPSNGLIDIKKVSSLLEMNIEKDDFSSLKKPFYCSVVNLNSGHSEIKSDGKLFQWVLASASIPIIFEPQVIDGNSYVDGGFVIDPPETRKFNTFDFKKADELFRIGFDETEKRILEMFDSINLSQVIQENSRKAIKNI